MSDSKRLSDEKPIPMLVSEVLERADGKFDLALEPQYGISNRITWLTLTRGQLGTGPDPKVADIIWIIPPRAVRIESGPKGNES